MCIACTSPMPACCPRGACCPAGRHTFPGGRHSLSCLWWMRHQSSKYPSRSSWCQPYASLPPEGRLLSSGLSQPPRSLCCVPPWQLNLHLVPTPLCCALLEAHAPSTCLCRCHVLYAQPVPLTQAAGWAAAARAQHPEAAPRAARCSTAAPEGGCRNLRRLARAHQKGLPYRLASLLMCPSSLSAGCVRLEFVDAGADERQDTPPGSCCSRGPELQQLG